jgi:hypothetical protein
VAARGKTIVAGSAGYGSTGGAAYFFIEPATGRKAMTQTAILTPSDGNVPQDGFGEALTIVGNTIFVGAASQLSLLADFPNENH